MVETQAACFCSSGSTLKPCFSTVTPPSLPSVGMPSLAIQERKGYSLPKNQTPRVWPGKSSGDRSEEHTSELQLLMRISYAVFCLKKKTKIKRIKSIHRIADQQHVNR